MTTLGPVGPGDPSPLQRAVPTRALSIAAELSAFERSERKRRDRRRRQDTLAFFMIVGVTCVALGDVFGSRVVSLSGVGLVLAWAVLSLILE